MTSASGPISSAVRAVEGDLHSESSSGPGRDCQGAGMGVDDRLDDRQAEPRAVSVPCALGCEALEWPGESVDRAGVDAGPALVIDQGSDSAMSRPSSVDQFRAHAFTSAISSCPAPCGSLASTPAQRDGSPDRESALSTRLLSRVRSCNRT
jgi:hypothetical protein